MKLQREHRVYKGEFPGKREVSSWYAYSYAHRCTNSYGNASEEMAERPLAAIFFLFPGRSVFLQELAKSLVCKLPAESSLSCCDDAYQSRSIERRNELTTITSPAVRRERVTGRRPIFSLGKEEMRLRPISHLARVVGYSPADFASFRQTGNAAPYSV